jgi:Domain of unknown function (DUF1707)
VAAPNDYGYEHGGGPRDRSLRVGDKERDAVSEILRQRHVEGRLDSDEFQTRLERCFAAKTYAELDELVSDFPREEAEHRATSFRSLRALPFALPFLVLVLVAALAGGHVGWLAVPLVLLFVVRPLVWGGRGGRYGVWACGPRRRITRA